MYTEAHNTSHARTRLQNGVVINNVLDHTLQREAFYTNYHNTTKIAEKVNLNTLHLSAADGEVPAFTKEKHQLQHLLNSTIRREVKMPLGRSSEKVC